MTQEEEKILKDLVTQSLASKGFLGKIQAEIRAGVFAALEEQDVLKDIFINKSLKDFLETAHGALVISLIREFLEFFNLHFTNMVFDCETHAGIDYTYDGRKKLAADMNLPDNEGENVPLLGLLLQSLDLSNSKNNLNNASVNGHSDYKDHENEAENTKPLASIEVPLTSFSDLHQSLSPNNDRNLLNNESSEKLINLSYENQDKTHPHENKMTSLNDLPPLNDLKSRAGESFSSKVDMKQLNELLQFEPDGGNYDEDFISSGSDKKDKTDSTESEIEEELPSNSNHSNEDDVTADMTVSKESGQGDYTETLSNS